MRSLIGLSLLFVLAAITYGVHIGQDASKNLVLTYGKTQPSGNVVEFSPVPVGVDLTGWVWGTIALLAAGIGFLIRRNGHKTELSEEYYTPRREVNMVEFRPFAERRQQEGNMPPAA